MKKISFVIFLFLLALSASATITFSGKELKIKPGESTQLEISMSNDAEFSGFQLDIVLPEGITVQGKTKKQQTQLCGILEELEFDYTVGTTSSGNYGIRVYSTDGLTINPSNGTIITINVKAEENITLGEKDMKIINIILSQGGQAVDLENVSFKANVYQEYTFSVASANEEMGNVTGENGTYESGTSITVSAIPTEGYHFVKWSDEATNNPYTLTVNNNVNLTATFAPNQYYIIYMIDGNEWARDEVTYGTPIVKRDYTPEVGKTFSGWMCEEEYVVMPAHDVVYTGTIGTATGIQAIYDSKEKIKVFSVTGVLLNSAMHVDDLQKMPKGIYIINGQKVVLR